MGKYGHSNRYNYSSNQIKLGNKTWINEGKLPTTVEQINFGLEPVGKQITAYCYENCGTTCAIEA